jgi:hypothetical protein
MHVGEYTLIWVSMIDQWSVCVCVRSLGPIHVAVDYRHKVCHPLALNMALISKCIILLIVTCIPRMVIEESLAKGERACCKKTKYHRLCTTLFRAALSVVYE